MNFEQKPPEELKKQVEKVEKILGVPIAPEPLENLDDEKIHNDYRARYEAYLAVLRESKKEAPRTQAIDHARDRVTALNSLNEFILSHHTEDGDTRGERQASVYKDMQAFLERGGTSGYVKLPTGVGKTVIFSHLIEALGLKTVIVVPTKILVGQTGDKLDQFTDVEFGRFFSQEKNLNNPVTITTYSSLVAKVKDGTIDPKDVSVLILDEVHRSLGEETQKIIEQFSGIRIGFTATDTFSDRRNVSQLLGETIHSMSLREAIQEGSLCTTQTIHAHTTVDLSSVPMVGDEYHQGALEQAVNVATRNKAAVNLYKEGFMGRKTVCNCSGVKHAKTLAKMFNEQGIASAVVDAKTPEKSRNGVMGREEIFEKFATGEILVLCNAKVLVEGFDAPSCSASFNLHPTRSLVDAEQRGGRSLRLDPNNPDKVGCVVDFIDMNTKKKPILFSEIIGGNVVVPREKEKKDDVDSISVSVGGTKSVLFPAIEVEGLRVSVDPQEILLITKEYEESREKKEFDFEKHKQDVWATGIKSSKEYQKLAASKGWMSSETLIKRPEFTNWDDFLNREALERAEFLKLQKSVRVAGIKSSGEYSKVAPSKGWMSSETLIKRPDFKGWDDFLEREVEVFDFVVFQKEVQAAGIKSSGEYVKNAPLNGWMSYNTLIKRPEFISWDDFLNRKDLERAEFLKLQESVRVAGIKSSSEYLKNASLNGWMSHKALTRRPDFKGWDDFLEREVEVFDFVVFQKEVQAAGIKSSRKYAERCSLKGWMGINSLTNRPEWISWDDFLGKEKFDFAKLQEAVRTAGIKSSREYAERCSSKGWMAEATLRKQPDFKGWDDFLGREKS